MKGRSSLKGLICKFGFVSCQYLAEKMSAFAAKNGADPLMNLFDFPGWMINSWRLTDPTTLPSIIDSLLTMGISMYNSRNIPVRKILVSNTFVEQFVGSYFDLDRSVI